MGFVFWFLFIFLCGYGAYRAIRGGFERPQSDKLTGYGIIGCIVLVLAAMWLVRSLFS
jgi:prolipoprotein diacylglyceryltransferase